MTGQNEQRDDGAHDMVIRLESLSDDELKTLQAAFPMQPRDASDPRKDFNRRIDSEFKRRGLR
jgi:hypothetical protein